MTKLAIFDVDYTLTKKETLLEFYSFCTKNKISNLKYIPRVIYSGLMFGLNIYDEKKTKQTFLKFIRNMDEDSLKELVHRYYKERLRNILYKDGIDELKRLKNEGYMVILVSASPEFYLNELYDIEEVDIIIGTRFEFKDGIFTGKMVGENCKGKEKVKRLEAMLSSKNIVPNYKESMMFSDSLSDKPLLDLVGNPRLINFKKDPKGMKVLNWS